MMEMFCDSCRQHLKNFMELIRRASENLLQKIKDFFTSIQCCCCLKRNKPESNRFYKPVLQQHEKEAAQQFLQHVEEESKMIDNECLEALRTLAASENPSLQQSAALYYLHISEQLKNELPDEYLEPYCDLLRSNDLEVQRKASLSLVNLLVEGNVNKETVVQVGLLEPILELLRSGDATVQCNSCACVATLATSVLRRNAIASEGGIKPLLGLAKSYDPRVQQNAAGAILNLTKSEKTQHLLCKEGALPVLILHLQSPDSEVQYYSCSALTNIASNPLHHPSMLRIGDGILLKMLQALMSSTVVKVCCQACYCLRNLFLNADTQDDIVAMNFLPQLHELLKFSNKSVNEAALSVLSVLSENHSNTAVIVSENILKTLGKLLLIYKTSPGISNYVANIIQKLATSGTQQAIIDSGCVVVLLQVLGLLTIHNETLLYVTACIAQLTNNEKIRTQIIQESDVNVAAYLLMLSSQSGNIDLSFQAAYIISQLGQDEMFTLLLRPHVKEIVGYVLHFLKHQEIRFQHLGLLTIRNFRKDSHFAAAFSQRQLIEQLNNVSQQTAEMQELLQAVLYQNEED
ncbi:vacuolar protein 8-like isoform X1 [Rhincodon typus]|uniref:vacuolar protein 8-like isoform X1 n=1 Tax=Rhincodon typus TaxID=259920 RepID=UPI00202EC808|nr:vacuolar protein 8-like isoform X1 [Rhincodon typus]XP_048453197.1 vacuolar protein 8-like isoform X1 [Rhincodon typus]